jgi:protein-disulfide isomerase
MTHFPLSRRMVLSTAAGSALVAASGAASSLAWAQKKADAPISVEDLMKPDALGDLVLGKADAPCTIVEYASMTCGHCGAFHTKVLPLIKEKYITTGKVRFIMREFPLDTLAAAASMLARCAGGEKTVPMIDVLFAKQEDWAFQRQNAVPELFKIAKQAGFTQESFDKCLTDQALLDKISQGRERASKDFGVDATPTFFINGKKLKDGPTIEAFDKAIAEATKS